MGLRRTGVTSSMSLRWRATENSFWAGAPQRQTRGEPTIGAFDAERIDRNG